MKENGYVIEIKRIDEQLSSIEDSWDDAIEYGYDDEDYLMEILETKKFFKSLRTPQRVHTLEEYFELLNNIIKHSDDGFRVYNGGKIIELCT